MLLTKPLSNFLNANRSPHIHTLFLATPTGKLLSSSSSTPAALLRNQATIASSIWELYGPLTTAGTIGAALPSPPSSADSSPTPNSPSSDDESGGRHGNAPPQDASDPTVSSIVIQLETGVMVIRALRCSLLFVIIGPSPSSLASSISTRGLTQGVSFLSLQSATTVAAAASSSSSPPASSHSQANGDGGPAAERRVGGSSSASLNGLSSGGSGCGPPPVGPSLKVFKRLAEELAKCLDVELEGFTLSTGL